MPAARFCADPEHTLVREFYDWSPTRIAREGWQRANQTVAQYRRDAAARMRRVQRERAAPLSTTTIREHKAREGRPDFAMLDGVLHVDLPGVRKGGALRHPKRGTAPEREFILRMKPHMASIMHDGDLAEAKAGVARQQIATAIGQLLLRRMELGIPGCNYLVVPTWPNGPLTGFCNNLDIRLVVEGEVA